MVSVVSGPFQLGDLPALAEPTVAIGRRSTDCGAMNQNAQYSDATRDSLQRIFGKGFTSPGGREEMARLLDGLDLTGQTVMDLGCGLGGDSLLLGGPFGAGKVVSVDVDPGNLDVTGRAVREAGLEDVIAPTLVDPGPMPFPDGSFDVVHSKAMICHIQDKAALFSEVQRVLRPGGSFVAADWMTGPGEILSQSYNDFANDLADAGLIFFFQTAAEHENALQTAGFAEIALEDASPHILNYAQALLDRVAGEAEADLRATLGEEGYAGILRRSRGRVDALASGDLQFQYIRAKTGTA